MKLFNLLVLMLVCLFCSCNNNNSKISSIETKQKTIVTDSINKIDVYNSVLETLLKSNINYAVLENKGIKLQLDYYNNRIDSLTYIELKNKLQNNIIANDSLKNDLFMLDNRESDSKIKIDHINFGDNFKSTKDDILKHLQKSMSIDFLELESSFVNLKKESNQSNESPVRKNKLSFSDIFFSEDQSYGTLYYSFACSSKCGHGAVLIIKKNGDNWYIEKTIMLYEI